MESKNYQLNEAKMFADVTDGIAIIINAVTGIYYGMNGYGTGIFSSLLAGASTADVLAADPHVREVYLGQNFILHKKEM